jgi:hypothetical protein
MFGLLRVFQSLDDPCVVVNGSNEASTWLTQTFSIGQDFVSLLPKPLPARIRYIRSPSCGAAPSLHP